MGFVASLTLHKQHHPLLPACPSGGLYTSSPPPKSFTPEAVPLQDSAWGHQELEHSSCIPSLPTTILPQAGGLWLGVTSPVGPPHSLLAALQRPVLGGTTRRAAGRRDSKATARGRCEACKTWCLSGVCRTYQQALTGILA